MKKTLLSITLLAGSAFPLLSQAVDGNLFFTGEILANTCAINAGDMSQSLVLGGIAKNAFPSAGSTASVIPFSIHLEDCDNSLHGATVRFDGTRDAINSDLLALTPGGATGVAVALFESNGTTPIPMNADSQSVAITGDITTLNFVAKYQATATPASITAGPANAVAQFTLNYN